MSLSFVRRSGQGDCRGSGLRTKKLRPTRIVPGAKMLKQGPVDLTWWKVRKIAHRPCSTGEGGMAATRAPSIRRSDSLHLQRTLRGDRIALAERSTFSCRHSDTLPRERTAAVAVSGREWGDAAPWQGLSWLARHPSHAAKRIAYDLRAPMANRSAFLSTKGTINTLLG